MKSNFTIGLVGNPNSGKTTLFNALTGAKQRVGNWPGVTVEKKSGEVRMGESVIEIVDLPGTYSLDVVDDTTSIDERIARDYIHDKQAKLIVNIIDAANLERNLYLTTQLLEMGVLVVVALNMMDVAEAKGMKVDATKLAEQLGCPVIPIVAARGKGIDDLKAAILETASTGLQHTIPVTYDKALEEAVTDIARRLESTPIASQLASRWLAVRLLEKDDLVLKDCDKEIAALAAQHAAKLEEDLDIMVADARYTLANKITRATVKASGVVEQDITDRIDKVVLNRFLGIPIFLLMMYLMFMFTIQIGGAFIDFFDQFTGALLVDGLGHWMNAVGMPQWLTFFMTKGVGAGIQTVATFVPIIAFLYLFLSFLEDSGYMARAAFVMDRFMRWIGLPGKSFVPLLVGFGCNVPAIMATRTLEQRKDRLLTIAMAPFMSCGARLPVYILFAAAFFPEQAQNAVFALYLIGFAVAVLTGLTLKHTLLKGDVTPFIMELPPYHLPTMKGVLRNTWSRLNSFIFRAGRVIVPMVLVLNVMNSVGTDGTFGHEDSNSSVLAAVGRTIAPAFSPFGVTQENWPAAVGIFTGILAKEATVGTLNATYKSMAAQESPAAEAEEPFSLGSKLGEALATIPANLGDAFGHWRDPLGVVVADVTEKNAAAEELEVSTDTFGAMQAKFTGAAGAFAYMLFILLYFPCAAAIAAVYQESGTKWTLFVAAWTTGMAYAAATLCYQVANFAAHPLSATVWIVIVGLGFVGSLFAMRRATDKQAELGNTATQGA